MRGIGKGQRIVLFIIPEVERLKAREAARGRGSTPAERAAQMCSMPQLLSERAQLEDITAWLLLNSFRWFLTAHCSALITYC